METGRREHRTAVTLTGRLLGTESPREPERVSIENISLHGARVLARREWQPHSHVILAGTGSDFYADAQVVYCQPVREGVCAVGLQFTRALEADRVGRLFP
ncbi:MAG TPA: PilZ domain-containing protein [Steroidobacteraceae bacterium]|nr:PilZ domain-containing protein [Steroidobacteraceae bacterium]